MSKKTEKELNRLFVYGIFLGAYAREIHGMSGEYYATVKDYCTYGNIIVAAVKQPNLGLALTGLIVNVDPKKWPIIDRLEFGYDRVKIETTTGEKAWMYVGKT